MSLCRPNAYETVLIKLGDTRLYVSNFFSFAISCVIKIKITSIYKSMENHSILLFARVISMLKQHNTCY